jgi:hypothetical protein
VDFFAVAKYQDNAERVKAVPGGICRLVIDDTNRLGE